MRSLPRRVRMNRQSGSGSDDRARGHRAPVGAGGSVSRHRRRLRRIRRICRRWRYFRAGHQFSIGDLEISPFTIPHDAADPCGFVFEAEGIRMALATDLGYVPPNVKAALKRIDVLLLESNHDLEMLRDGPYPWSVKQRVLSRVGHLSNDATGGVSDARLRRGRGVCRSGTSFRIEQCPGAGADYGGTCDWRSDAIAGKSGSAGAAGRADASHRAIA